MRPQAGSKTALARSNVKSSLDYSQLISMAKILVCVAWPYANGALHLGHVAGSLLAPDIFARYHRLRGDEVLMVSGSDQHGTPVTVRAEKEGVPVEQVAERFHQINSKAIKDLGIIFDLYTKTHNPNHFEVVHDVFTRLLENGFLYKKGTMQYYCSKCNKFLPDRYVEGVCNKCGNERARGDQCEKCGATFDAGDLGNARCTTCGTTPELRDALEKIRNETQPDIKRVWLEYFAAHAKCPKCQGSLELKGNKLRCACDFEVRTR